MAGFVILGAVGIVAVVGIVAIVFGRGFSGTVSADRVSIEVGEDKRNITP